MTEPRLVDLHVHTTASDGSLPPAAVVALAREAGLAAIAITDHDTVAGVAEAVASGEREGVEVLPGLEVSAELSGGTMHILGYSLDATDAALLDGLRRFQDNRNERNPRILARLADLGMPVRLEDVAAHAGGEVVGRPHIAQAMLDAGYVRSVEEAFDRYLARGSSAYVERRRAQPEEAVRLIRDAGGLAVLAHPKQLRRTWRQTRDITARLADCGLEGLEVYHPDHSADESSTYRLLAESLGLVVVGGTDFHGHARQSIRLGVGRGSLRVSYEAVEQIRERLALRSR